MRSHNAYDRDGNSYRYHRQVAIAKELEERIEQERKWDKIYDGFGQKAISESEKGSDTELK